MRPIKVRAWDGKQFFYWGLFFLDERYGTIFAEPPRTISKTPAMMEHSLWTGRADLKKKDIYEGDILRHIHQYGTCYQKVQLISTEDREGQRIVGYELDYCIDQDAEIIGNIYENPELWEKIK